MLAIFHISDETDDAGVTTYKAMLQADFDGEGILDPSAPVGRGETVWDALTNLIALVDTSDPYQVLYMGEDAL